MEGVVSNYSALIKFCSMRKVDVLLSLNVIPNLVQTLPKSKLALPVLRYLLEDVSENLAVASVYGLCNFSITDFCDYPTDYCFCVTCKQTCCLVCQRNCHKGHEIQWFISEEGWYCECYTNSCLAKRTKGINN